MRPLEARIVSTTTLSRHSAPTGRSSPCKSLAYTASSVKGRMRTELQTFTPRPFKPLGFDFGQTLFISVSGKDWRVHIPRERQNTVEFFKRLESPVVLPELFSLNLSQL